MTGAIEILGLPGSGKTTLVREMTQGRIGMMPEWSGPPRRGRLPMAAQLFLSAPLFSAAAYLLLLTRSKVTWVAMRRVLSVQRRFVILRQRNGDEERILDEGPVHALYVAMYGTGPTLPSRFLLSFVLRELASTVDRYIYLGTPKEACIANFRSPGRTSVRFNLDSDPTTIEIFRRDSTYEEILVGLRAVAGAKLQIADDIPMAIRMIKS